jgi:hypothetical protein
VQCLNFALSTVPVASGLRWKDPGSFQLHRRHRFWPWVCPAQSQSPLQGPGPWNVFSGRKGELRVSHSEVKMLRKADVQSEQEATVLEGSTMSPCSRGSTFTLLSMKPRTTPLSNSRCRSTLVGNYFTSKTSSSLGRDRTAICTPKSWDARSGSMVFSVQGPWDMTGLRWQCGEPFSSYLQAVLIFRELWEKSFSSVYLMRQTLCWHSACVLSFHPPWSKWDIERKSTLVTVTQPATMWLGTQRGVAGHQTGERWPSVLCMPDKSLHWGWSPRAPVARDRVHVRGCLQVTTDGVGIRSTWKMNQKCPPSDNFEFIVT